MLPPKDQLVERPQHLDEKFFVTALEEGLRAAQVRISDIKFTWGSKPGDNYCSKIYRVLIRGDVRFESEWEPLETSLVVKELLVTPGTKFIENANVFIKEKKTYYDVLPYLETLSDGDVFAAKCFYVVKEPAQIFVFEDLKVDGFRMASRQNQLDWNHSVLILKQLAKFHAASMVLIKKYPSLTKHYKNGLCSKQTIFGTDVFVKVLQSHLSKLIATCSAWPNYEEITKKLQRYEDNFKNITVKLLDNKPGDRYKVLNHGDLWTNNFMFAYDDKNNNDQPTRAKFVDFQLCFYGSPGCDINLFLSTSVQYEVLKNKREQLVDIYYETFVEALQYLRFKDIPTRDDLNFELRSRELYGFFGTFAYLPITTLSNEYSNDVSMENYIKEQKTEKVLSLSYQNATLITNFKYNLKRFDDLGVLDEF